MPCPGEPIGWSLIPNSFAFWLSLLSCFAEIGSATGKSIPIVGTLWSAVAIVRSGRRTDRKSTRLNSSHVKISYAVFCLKKKKQNKKQKVYQQNETKSVR